MKDELRTLMDAAGAIRRADHRALARAIDAALAAGDLVAPFRAVYTRPNPDFRTRARALMLADPAAVLTEASAAYLMGWAPDPPATLTAATRLRPRAGFVPSRRSIPPRHIQDVGGIRLTSRALTAIDLATTVGASAIDDALRRRVTLDELWDAYALTPNRRGRDAVRFVLRTSRTLPWSPAERAGHAALRGVRGWVANRRVGIAPGRSVYLDIAFPAIRLAIEIDGKQHRASEAAVTADMLRDLRLAVLGWQVVRFKASWVLGHPDEFASLVATLVAVRTRQLSGR